MHDPFLLTGAAYELVLEMHPFKTGEIMDPVTEYVCNDVNPSVQAHPPLSQNASSGQLSLHRIV